MPADEQRLEQLFNLWYNQSITEPESKEFFDLLQQAEGKGMLEGLMKEAYDNLKEENFFTAVQKDSIADSIIGKKEKAKIFTLRRIVAAASILLIIGVGGYLAVVGLPGNKPKPATETIATKDVEAPKGTRAVIVLADGSKVYLDSVGNGTVAQQSNVVVTKVAGKIIYSGAGTANGEIVYNTLSNPRGSKVIDIQLSDGSHVWLNAGSSVKYPVAFVGNDRTVEITGEAYFEVAHNASKPFHVKKGETDVTVLGTHFNVNAYDDEDALRVTLLEGSVKVTSNRSQVSRVIKPGQQAKAVNGELSVVGDVDTEQVMAWKNGRFLINGADIKTVMRELARWYDIQVVYKGEVHEKFRVGIDRNTNVSNVFKILEATGAVRFTIEGRTVTVMP